MVWPFLHTVLHTNTYTLSKLASLRQSLVCVSFFFSPILPIVSGGRWSRKEQWVCVWLIDWLPICLNWAELSWADWLIKVSLAVGARKSTNNNNNCCFSFGSLLSLSPSPLFVTDWRLHRRSRRWYWVLLLCGPKGEKRRCGGVMPYQWQMAAAAAAANDWQLMSFWMMFAAVAATDRQTATLFDWPVLLLVALMRKMMRRRLFTAGKSNLRRRGGEGETVVVDIDADRYCCDFFRVFPMTSLKFNAVPGGNADCFLSFLSSHCCLYLCLLSPPLVAYTLLLNLILSSVY